jgi:hypothetical protein
MKTIDSSVHQPPLRQTAMLSHGAVVRTGHPATAVSVKPELPIVSPTITFDLFNLSYPLWNRQSQFNDYHAPVGRRSVDLFHDVLFRK